VKLACVSPEVSLATPRVIVSESISLRNGMPASLGSEGYLRTSNESTNTEMQKFNEAYDTVTREQMRELQIPKIMTVKC
jgi:hypothetical protein